MTNTELNGIDVMLRKYAINDSGPCGQIVVELEELQNWETHSAGIDVIFV